jgi:diguanylate cyclase (GGDEF)-like protein/PAS domain S-box-containing protein
MVENRRTSAAGSRRVETGTTGDVTTDPLDLFAGPGGPMVGAAARLTGLACWSSDGEHLWWSAEMSVLAGYPARSGRAGMAAAAARIVGDDLQQLLAAAARCRAGDGPQQLTVPGRPRDGRLRHLRVRIALLPGTDGGPDLIWGTCLDLSDEHDRLAEVQAGREELRLAFDQAPIGMVLVSRDPPGKGRVLRMNEIARQAFGIDGDPAGAVDLARWIRPDQRAGHREHTRRLCSGEVTEAAYEVQYRHRSGAWRDVWVRAVATRGEAGSPGYVLYHLLDVTVWYADRHRLERQAWTDPVTGQGNRQLLAERTARATGPLLVLLVDVDGFRRVNAVHGQAAGDGLLTELGRRLQEAAPAGACVGRLDADTFAVLVPRSHPTDAAVLVGQLQQTCREPVTLPDGSRLAVSVRIGSATGTPVEGCFDVLSRRAELALREAKALAPGSAVAFDEVMLARADARIVAENRLRACLESGGVRVALQPVVHLGTGQVASREVLVRFEHPELGPQPVDELVSVAEETGLVAQVDRAVARLALPLMATAPHTCSLAINVSARTLADPLYVADLAALLERYGVAAGRLTVEVTETSLLDPEGTAALSLRRLAGLGVRVAIDDFGTGYSALAYLQSFDPDCLKIDRSFVSRLGSSPRADAVVSAIIGLAHAHDLSTVAEGVETTGQADILRSMGCDLAQGNLFGAPAAVRVPAGHGPAHDVEVDDAVQSGTAPGARVR